MICGTCTAQSSGTDTIKRQSGTAFRNVDFQTRNVKSQDTLIIRLNAAIGQGSSWELTDACYTENLRFEKQLYETQTQSRSGSDGIQVFYFKPIKPGTVTIRFIYGRPFNKPYPKNAPLITYKIIIT